MALSSSARAARIDLIIIPIFEELVLDHRYKTLVSCLSVSRKWEDEVRPILFRHLGHNMDEKMRAQRKNQMLGPTLQDLLQMPTTMARKQLYANCVRSMMIADRPARDRLGRVDSISMGFLNRLVFSRLQELHIADPGPLLHDKWYFRTLSGGRLSKLLLGDIELNSSDVDLISDQCPRLTHFRVMLDDPEKIATLVNSLPLLETLDLLSVPDLEANFDLFDAVARHAKLRSVDGLSVKSSWIQNLGESDEGVSWFVSLTHLGLIRASYNDNDGFHFVKDYADSIQLLPTIIPKLASLSIWSQSEIVFKSLVALENIQKLEVKPWFVDPDDYEPETLSVAKILEQLTHMENLRILQFTSFRRSRKETIPEYDANIKISWRDVETFTNAMPNLEELSFNSMHLTGMTPGHAPSSYDYSPVTWKRKYGWEILEWDLCSSAFKEAMAEHGRFMPHNYFGPYKEGVDSIYEYVDAGRPWDEDDNDKEIWKEHYMI